MSTNMMKLPDFSNLSIEELQVASMAAIQESLKRLAERQTRLEDETIKRTRELEHKINAQSDVLTNALRAKNPRNGWVNLRDFGLQFHVTISNRRIGKLLRVVGIAQKNASSTVPKREYVGDGRLCTNVITHAGYSQRLWNYRRCMSHIDLWLREHDLFEEFYSIDSEQEMERFIDALYLKYNS